MNTTRPPPARIEDVRKKLRAYIADNHLPPRTAFTISDDEDLFEIAVLDSAALLSLLGFIEELYGISIPDEDLLPEHFSSIESASRYIALATSARAGGGGA